jgi:hypothetical protein
MATSFSGGGTFSVLNVSGITFFIPTLIIKGWKAK